MEDLARRQQNEEPELTLYDREQIPYVTYQDFIDKELVLFSYASLQRAIPNCIDGFKPGQRKARYFRNLCNFFKIFDFARNNISKSFLSKNI